MRVASSRPPRGVGSIVAMTIAIGSATAQVEGILEPLPACPPLTHRIVDTCTGVEHWTWSSWMDLGPFVCQHVQAEGTPSGLTCPGLDIQTINSSPPPCPIEVQAVELFVESSGTPIAWSSLACADTYDVIRGVLGVPASNACDDLHPCPEGYVCERLFGDCGGIGVCRLKPPGCFFDYAPVCGCDGVRYSNTCWALQAGVTAACSGACPCPTPCSAAEGCLDIGPVICTRNDIPASPLGNEVLDTQVPPAGQAFFYLVRAKGRGVVGTTTYGFTTDGRERLFAGDCPR